MLRLGAELTKIYHLNQRCRGSPTHIYVNYRKVSNTVYPKKYAHGFCFAVLCCGYTSTDFPISIRLTSLALRQSNDCPSASKAALMNMDKYFMWIHYERLHNHNKAKHNKTVCIFLGVYCIRPTLVGNKCVDHSDVVGASPVGAAPTTSSFSLGFNGLGKDNCKTRRETFLFWDWVRLILENWR